MALIRFNLQGAIPFPSNQKERDFLAGVKNNLRIIKEHCVESSGLEHFNMFQWHKCYHDEPEPHPRCEDWQDI